MVNLQYNTALKNFYAEDLPAITEIDLTNNTQLEKYVFSNCSQLVSIKVNDNFSMDNCLFSSAGNNPELSIFNTTSTFYYVGQYIINSGQNGVVCEITNSGQQGMLVSTLETYDYRDNAESWCSTYGAGWELPSTKTLATISANKKTINLTLSALGYTTLTNNYYWAKGYYFTPSSTVSTSINWYVVHLSSGNSNTISVSTRVNEIKYPTSRFYIRAIFTI